MSFSSDWLTLRRPADEAARNPDVAAAVSTYFKQSSGLRVLDLGAGTGSNRMLSSPLLPAEQNWMLADADAGLLAHAQGQPGVETQVVDLASDLETLLSAKWDLVTCSALLDLCGAGWLDEFASLLARHRLPVFAVLSYDGREVWEPEHPLDQGVHDAFLADQRRDKGLGPSLGPTAHEYLVQRLRGNGFTVHEGASDWALTQADHPGLIAALAEGTGQVANEPVWIEARKSASRVVIGHMDLFAIPEG